MIETYPNLKFLDAVQDLRVTNMEFIQMSEAKVQIESTLEMYNCIHCSHFQEHVCINFKLCTRDECNFVCSLKSLDKNLI